MKNFSHKFKGDSFSFNLRYDSYYTVSEIILDVFVAYSENSGMIVPVTVHCMLRDTDLEKLYIDEPVESFLEKIAEEIMQAYEKDPESLREDILNFG